MTTLPHGPDNGLINGVDLSVDFAGIKAPNPFWLASAPPVLTLTQRHWLFRPGALTAGLRQVGQVRLRVLAEYADGAPADDLHPVLGLEDHDQPAPEQGVVVDDEDADRLRDAHLCRSRLRHVHPPDPRRHPSSRLVG